MILLIKLKKTNILDPSACVFSPWPWSVIGMGYFFFILVTLHLCLLLIHRYLWNSQKWEILIFVNRDLDFFYSFKLKDNNVYGSSYYWNFRTSSFKQVSCLILSLYIFHVILIKVLDNHNKRYHVGKKKRVD